MNLPPVAKPVVSKQSLLNILINGAVITRVVKQLIF